MYLVIEIDSDIEVIVFNWVFEYEAAAGLEFPRYKWPQELFYAIDLIPEYEFF